MEHRVVFDGTISFTSELVTVDKLRQEDLNLLKGKVESNAHSLPCCEWDVSGLVSILDLLGIPSIWVEAEWVVPDFWVVVNMVKGRNDNCIFGQLITSWKDKITLGSTSWLEGRVVAALGLFNVLVEEVQLVCELGSYLCVLIKPMVDQLLEESVLHSFVGAKAVDEPGEEGTCCSEPGCSGNNKCPDQA